MKGTGIALALCALLTLSALAMMPGSETSVEASFAGGTGTLEDPYQISTAEQLQAMNQNLNAHYELVSDIDCSDTVNWNGGAGFSPVGSMNNAFTGTLEGNGYTIKNLCIDRSSSYDVGLFGSIFSGQVSNLNLENVDFKGYGRVGGLVGYIYQTTLTSCTSSGEVYSSYYPSGGLVGLSYYATITMCSSSCDVVSQGNHVGGLVGWNRYATVSKCSATGDVSGNYGVGGLVSYNEYATVSNSYATGDTTATYYAAGLVALNAGSTVFNSYSAGQPTGYAKGGLVGSNYWSQSLTNCYWDIQTSGTSYSASGTGKPTAEMMQQATFTGWDFVDTWTIDEGNSYPYLQWEYNPTPEDLAGELIENIGELDLPGNSGSGMTDILDNVLKSLEKENVGAAVNQLGAFINKVKATQNSGKLSLEDGDILIAKAQAAIDMLESEEL